MPDCACIQRFSGAWRSGGEGRARSIPQTLGNKIPTHSAVVWQGSYRKGILERAGWPPCSPSPSPALALEVYLVGGRGLAGRGGYV